MLICHNLQLHSDRRTLHGAAPSSSLAFPRSPAQVHVGIPTGAKIPAALNGALRPTARPVNHWVVLTRECESSESETPASGRNPDGCTRYPESRFQNRE